MLGFRRATVLEAPDSVRRVAATGMVGRRDQANRATVPPAHIACSQGWTLKRVRPGPKRWPWSGREPSRPKPLDIKGPIQGLLRLHARYGPLDCSTAQGGLCHEASTRPVARPGRSSATRSIDNSLGGTFLHW